MDECPMVPVPSPTSATCLPSQSRIEQGLQDSSRAAITGFAFPPHCLVREQGSLEASTGYCSSFTSKGADSSCPEAKPEETDFPDVRGMLSSAIFISSMASTGRQNS